MTTGQQPQRTQGGPSPRLLVAAAILVGLGLAAYFILQTYWQRQQPVLRDPAGLLNALTQFSREKMARGQTVPATISLKELVGAGYVKPEDAAAFKGVELTFYPTALGTFPQAMVARARLADGSQVYLLADGSVRTTMN